jgi:hypothetical protein
MRFRLSGPKKQQPNNVTLECWNEVRDGLLHYPAAGASAAYFLGI